MIKQPMFGDGQCARWFATLPDTCKHKALLAVWIWENPTHPWLHIALMMEPGGST
jgi:hypothetical protein